MTTFGRRKFLVSSGSATLAMSLATLATSRSAHAADYGNLVKDPKGVLDLPKGFSYRILEKSGSKMSDGYRVPTLPDGMACFPGPDNTLILMRNHEINIGKSKGPYASGQKPAAESYNSKGRGGVTRVVIDAKSFERISSNLVLVGTARNCNGGPSPFGWFTGEEEVTNSGSIKHGYVFLCPIDADKVQKPQKITGYGRYNHEAVAFDPSNNYAYLTEDRGDACFYRFVPDAMDKPFVGQLQALKIAGKKDTNKAKVGDVLDVEWVDIDEPDPKGDTVRKEAKGKGAATFKKTEGAWFFEGAVYICASGGGSKGIGQIFRLIDGDKPTLEVIVHSTDKNVLDKPDAITVAPWGEIFMAEDGDGGNYIQVAGTDGKVSTFAKNALSSNELSGVCFSPDGRAMFVNLQKDGLTLVVTGPFPGADIVENPGPVFGFSRDGIDESVDEGPFELVNQPDDELGDEVDELDDEELEFDDEELGLDDEAMSCSTTTKSSGEAALLAGAAVLGVGALLRKRADDQAE